MTRAVDQAVKAASTIIIPVESQVRELDAKVLLAAVAAERGFPVVLGSRPYVSFALPGLPRGVFFAKSMRFTSDRMTRYIRAFGHHMVASDEESLVRFAHPDYYPWRFSEHTFSSLEHLFAWGQDDAEMLRGYPGRGDVAVHATGNPRTDLLRENVRRVFDDEAAQLRLDHGPFILVNTNFSFVNNFVPSLNLIQVEQQGEPQVSRTGRGMSLEFALGMARHQQAIFDGFIDLMPRLARAFPQHTVVLRPHPSEDHERWRQLTAEFGNVRVLHEGNVVPWLMAADVLLHNGCTTAVEGALLGIPAVSYQPVVSDDHDYHLPNGLSIQVNEADAVLDAVAEVTSGRAAGVCEERRRRILGRHVESTPDALAADRIVDVLTDAGYLQRRPPPPSWGRYAQGWLGTHIRTLEKKINMRRQRHRNSTAYLRHRFPPIDAAVVNGRLRRLAAVLGRFEGIAAQPLGQDLFTIGRR